jgi:hypothetical protein
VGNSRYSDKIPDPHTDDWKGLNKTNQERIVHVYRADNPAGPTGSQDYQSVWGIEY